MKRLKERRLGLGPTQASVGPRPNLHFGSSILCCIVLASCAFAQSPAEDLTQKLNAIHSLRADFSQKLSTRHRTLSTTSGRMFIQRPGRFRWETTKPNQQLILADGKRLWIYDVELEQVTSKPQANGLRGTPALFLTKTNDHLAEDFDVAREVRGAEERYQLRPKRGRGAFSSLTLTFKHNILTAIALDDPLSQHTQVSLQHVQMNQAIAAHYFQFKPPKGVDVIDE